MEEQIQRIIRGEIDRRVNEKVMRMLDIVSKTYDIALPRLLKDVNGVAGEGGGTSERRQCMGFIAQGSRCTRSGGTDGYCKSHLSQAPVIRTLAPGLTTTCVVQHTHSLPPLFLDGCPACEQQKRSRLNI